MKNVTLIYFTEENLLKRIPPLLGFYAKYLILSNISSISFYITLILIIASIISCVKYLSIIQTSNFKIQNNYSAKLYVNTLNSYLLSIFTILLFLGILKPIYLINILTYLIA